MMNLICVALFVQKHKDESDASYGAITVILIAVAKTDVSII
jgi:hypothetical protein